MSKSSSRQIWCWSKSEEL